VEGRKALLFAPSGQQLHSFKKLQKNYMLTKHKINFPLQILATTITAVSSTMPRRCRCPLPPATSVKQKKKMLSLKI
jgi:hypothetical protein